MKRRMFFCLSFMVLLLAGCSASKVGTNGVQTRETSVNGVSMQYEQQGRGETVVLVHGAIADYRAWDATRDAIAAHYRVIAPSNRYFGTGSWPDDGAKFSMQTHADDLAELIRGLNTGPVKLVGWSYGADICLVIAVQHPELVKSVFAFEPSSANFVTDAADRKIISADQQQAFGPAFMASKRGDQQAALRPFVDGVNGLPGTFDQLPARVQTVLSDNARTIPLQLNAPPPPAITCADLGKISVPVAIARGTSTRPFFRIAADTANQCIPGSRLVLIQDGRHLAPVEKPNEFNAALLAFLPT
ncbi:MULTISPECIES: alpha/beta hydrolase [unclassified Caballeronia]|uniref:alpha/beta hydrolase n=1 Tax=unclassified Caballeronia TaxID=2646786 RepID=UPI00285C141E|nr:MULTISPECIES: alpha/beta hydrolase [unclassified Caballeronia]MDR5755238.1 alpha/beta hydrolase [Caballeronia sp. LZ024]MDR5845105.1 alpha/beta hydrolase [Caballeronia sp. LZ031]